MPMLSSKTLKCELGKQVEQIVRTRNLKLIFSAQPMLWPSMPHLGLRCHAHHLHIADGNTNTKSRACIKKGLEVKNGMKEGDGDNRQWRG